MDIVNANADLAKRTQEVTEAGRIRDETVAYNLAIKVNNDLLEVEQAKLEAAGDLMRAQQVDLRRRLDALRYEIQQSKAEMLATAEPAASIAKGVK